MRVSIHGSQMEAESLAKDLLANAQQQQSLPMAPGSAGNGSPLSTAAGAGTAAEMGSAAVSGGGPADGPAATAGGGGSKTSKRKRDASPSDPTQDLYKVWI